MSRNRIELTSKEATVVGAILAFYTAFFAPHVHLTDKPSPICAN